LDLEAAIPPERRNGRGRHFHLALAARRFSSDIHFSIFVGDASIGTGDVAAEYWSARGPYMPVSCGGGGGGGGGGIEVDSGARKGD